MVTDAIGTKCSECEHDIRDHGRRGCLVVMSRMDGIYRENRASRVLCDCPNTSAAAAESDPQRFFEMLRLHGVIR